MFGHHCRHRSAPQYKGSSTLLYRTKFPAEIPIIDNQPPRTGDKQCNLLCRTRHPGYRVRVFADIVITTYHYRPGLVQQIDQQNKGQTKLGKPRQKAIPRPAAATPHRRMRF